MKPSGSISTKRTCAFSSVMSAASRTPFVGSTVDFIEILPGRIGARRIFARDEDSHGGYRQSVLVQDSVRFGVEIVHGPVHHLRHAARRQPRDRILGLVVEDERAWTGPEIEVLEQGRRGDEAADIAA